MFKNTNRKTVCTKCGSKNAELWEKQNEWKDLYVKCPGCGYNEMQIEEDYKHIH